MKKDYSFTRVHFVRDREGRPTLLEIHGIGPTEVATRVEV